MLLIMRLDRFVCKSTQLTKTQAVQLIVSAKVIVNGIPIIDEATQVHENNHITLNGQTLQPRPFRYILMHKAANTISSNIDEKYPSLFNEIQVDNLAELHIVGRLDVDTTGLVLITDDGRWSFNITAPKYHCEKVYRVGLSRPIADDVALLFKQGVQLQGEQNRTLPASLNIISAHDVRLTITEGKFHQVKRMFSAVNNRVISLHREKVGPLALDINVGQWRYLTADEVASFAK